MKKIVFGILIVFFGLNLVVAQDAETEKPKDKPVRSPFESGVLIDNQTSVIPTKGTLEMLIQHRFGKMNNGIKDVWGIYAPGANIRMGFNYTVYKNVQIGYGFTKKNMYSDFSVKWTILEQTRKNTIPVAVTVYGNMAIDGRNEDVFGVNYKFSNRMSYFSQLLVGRKFTDWLTLQGSGSFTHYNAVDTSMNHDVIGIGIIGRIKFSAQSSIIVQYDSPLKIKAISEQGEFEVAKSNFAFGYEVATSTHAFQIYVTTADGIVPQNIYMYNTNNWKHGVTDLMFGFTITRLWSF